MTEEFVIRYVPQRVEERGFSTYRMVFQDLNLNPGQEIKLAAYNEMWFLIEAGEEITISSDMGEYDYRNSALSENVHEHADAILVRNKSSKMQKVKFVQVILIG